MDSKEFLRVENISKSFGGTRALSRVSFRIHEREIVALLGENGSGKSTMIKIIAGVLRADAGSLYIRGQKLKHVDPISSIRAGIHVIYQDLSLFPNLTVAENISMSRFITHSKRLISWSEIYKIAQQGLSLVGADIDLGARVRDISVANRQIVAIARSIIEGSNLIIMDEPTAALTQHEIENLFRIITRLKKEGVSFLFVTHKLGEAKEIADRIVVFRDGKKVLDQEAVNVDVRTMEFYMTGRVINEAPMSKHRFVGEGKKEVLLRVRNLTLLPYFSDVSFSLRREEVLGITGLLGCGKTELALSLFGLLPLMRGEIYVKGKLIKIRSVRDAIVNGFAYVPEDRSGEGLFLPQSVGKNVCARIIDDLAQYGFVNDNIINTTADVWVRKLRIKVPSVRAAVDTLSGGNQQRVVLAKWLAAKPQILILNGPTIGVDVGSKADIHELIRELADSGVGIIIISDDIPEIVNVCDRVLLMRDGSIQEEFSQGDINNERISQALVSVSHE